MRQMIINTPADLQQADAGHDRQAFLHALLNDYITFDDANYPPEYDIRLTEGEAGYVAPVIRREWNNAAALQWSFQNREQIQAAIEAP